MNVTEFLNERGLFYTDIIGIESKMELIKCIEDYAKLYHESELKKERQIQLKQMLDDLDEGEDKITYKDNSTIMDEVVDLLK